MSVGKVYALCLRLIADSALAEKLTAEAFLTTWRKISLFREDTLFSSWLTGITTYTILEWIRNNGGMWSNLNQKKKKSLQSSLENNKVSPFDVDIQSLPDTERFVFVLHDIEKYSDEEVADLLSIDKKNVQEVLQRTYGLLKLPGDVTDGKVYVSDYLESLPQIVQPENDIWKYILAALHKEQESLSNKSDEYINETKEKILSDEKKKKFGFLSWKKNK